MQSICAALAALSLGLVLSAHADPLKVKTAQGKIHGKAINDGKVKAFLGLPYAAPPVGGLRWKAPEPPASWKGVRDATRFGAHCYQTSSFADMVFQDSGPSEDCLFLNVYSPSGATAKSKLPVMFWIHGGGYTGGAASEPRHNGDFLPTKGVVLVTINYRLGVMGFMVNSDLAKEAGGTAGNYGLMDMIAALQWVRQNIASFGGDPQNVTIFGESAGSFAVSTLMASERSRGLFAKAIGESGSGLDGGLGGGALADSEKRGDDWAVTLGAHSLAELRAIPAEKLIGAGRQRRGPGFSVVIDGSVLTEPVADTYAQGKQAHVPLLAGWNRDENAGQSNGMTVEKWKAFAVARFGDRSEEFLRLYPGDTDEQAIRSAIDYGSDSFIAFGTWKWIEAHSKTGDAPVYRYHFEQPAPPSKFHPGWSAFHSDDIEYVFGTLDTRPEAVWGPEERKLSERMMTYWTNFAKTGNPNGPGVPEWPKYGAEKQVIHLDSTITASPSTVEGRYEFLRDTPPPARP
jgi:para-nitrobenzyl esterase